MARIVKKILRQVAPITSWILGTFCLYSCLEVTTKFYLLGTQYFRPICLEEVHFEVVRHARWCAGIYLDLEVTTESYSGYGQYLGLSTRDRHTRSASKTSEMVKSPCILRPTIGFRISGTDSTYCKLQVMGKFHVGVGSIPNRCFTKRCKSTYVKADLGTIILSAYFTDHC